MVRWEPWTLPFPNLTWLDLRPVSFTLDGVPSQGHFWKFSYFGILKFEMCAFLTFSTSTDHFGRGCSALGVWYRYGRWCVGNLGPYPFQTWHDWICTPRLPCWKRQLICENFAIFWNFKNFGSHSHLAVCNQPNLTFYNSAAINLFTTSPVQPFTTQPQSTYLKR